MEKKAHCGRCFENFSRGDTTFVRKDIDEVLQKAVELNSSTITRELTRECGASKDTVSRHLLSMRKVKKRSILVPRGLVPQ